MTAAPAPTTAARVATPAAATRVAPAAQVHPTTSPSTPSPAVASPTEDCGDGRPQPSGRRHCRVGARTPASTAIIVSSPAERQARCTEILQKASLEKITPAETDFFKRECK